MSKEIKAVPAVIRRDAGHVNLEGERVMAVTFHLPAHHLQDFLDVGTRECTIVVPEAKPLVPLCTDQHGHPNPTYQCPAPAGHL